MPQSRRERLKADLFGDDIHEEWINDRVQQIIERENQTLWALYRALDVSQSEVIDMVGMTAEASQSTVSRALREHENRVLHDEEALTIPQKHKEDVAAYPEAWREAYRDAVAEALARVEALDRVAAVEKPTPEWAAVRYPELVGCHREVADELGLTEENVDIADETHLNGMDSVNIERWEPSGILRADS